MPKQRPVRVDHDAPVDLILRFPCRDDWLKFLGGPISRNVDRVTIVSFEQTAGRVVRLNGSLPNIEKVAEKFNAQVEKTPAC